MSAVQTQGGVQQAAYRSRAQDGGDAVAADLIALGKLSAPALERARRLSAESGERLEVVLTKLGFLSERDLAEALARFLALPLATAKDFPDTPILEDRMSPKFLREVRLIPLAGSSGDTIPNSNA